MLLCKWTLLCANNALFIKTGEGGGIWPLGHNWPIWFEITKCFGFFLKVTHLWDTLNGFRRLEITPVLIGACCLLCIHCLQGLMSQNGIQVIFRWSPNIQIVY